MIREADTSRLREIAARRRAQATEATEPEPAKPRERVVVEQIDDIPEQLLDTLDEVDDEAAREAQEDSYMRSVVDRLDVVRAYELFAGKGPVDGKEDGSGNIFVRCPTPDHVDNNPSAQVQPSTNKWVCHACGIGGDPIALVGAVLGRDYRNNRDYMEITKEICRELGEEFWVDSFGRDHIFLPVRDDSSSPEPEKAPETPEIPVHGDGTGLEDLFDPEEALAKGELTRPKPEPLPQDLEFLMDSMDEVEVRAPKNADRIQEKLRARRAGKELDQDFEKPTPTIPAAPRKTPPAPKAPVAGSKPLTPPPGLPRFNIAAMAIDEKPPATSDTISETDDIVEVPAPKTNSTPPATIVAEDPENEFEEIDPKDYPSINWREIIPSGTFIHEYMTHASRDDVIEEFHFWNAAMAVALACRRDLMLADSPLVYANLFVCNVAKTGAKKSKANDLFRRVIRSCEPMVVHNPEVTDGIRIIPKPNSGEVLIDHFMGKRELPLPPGAKKPPDPEIFPIAGLMQISELSGLLRAAARKDSTLETYLIQMYDCEDEVSSSARSTGGTTTAPQPYLCLSAGVQPPLIRTLVSKDMNDSGFANRFVWAYGPPKERQPLGDPDELPDAVSYLGLKLAEVRRNVESAGEFRPKFGGRVLYWDPAAKQLWFDFFRSTVNPAWESMPAADPASRAELLVKKLILIFTVNLGKTSVPPEAVEQAIAMWDYISTTYRMVGSNMTSTVARENEEEIIEVIRRHQEKNNGMGPTASEMRWGKMRNSLTVDDLNRILQSLIKMDIVEEMPPAKGSRGRPAKRYRLKK